MSELTQIWIKRMHKGPMDPAPKATVVAGKGLVGNANQGGKRQVTIVSNKAWEAVTAPLGATPDPRMRRASTARPARANRWKPSRPACSTR